MAATYTSSPSLAMIPLAGAGRQDGDRQRRSGAATGECGGRTRGGVKQIGGSWELDPGEAERARVYRRGDGSDWEGDGEKVGGEVNGRRAVYTALAYPLRASRSPLAPRRDLVGRDGILLASAPGKSWVFFF